MTQRRRLVALGLILTPLAVPAVGAAATVYDDTFEDGVVGPQWTVLNDAGSPLSLSEAGGRLNLLSPGGGTSTNDTLYLSNFRLSTAADFSMTIDYALNGVSGNGASGDRLGLVFGVGLDLPDGTDSAAIGVGYGNQFGFVGTASAVSYRVDDVTPAGLPTEVFSPLSGTLAIDYVFATDSLTLRRVGSGFGYTLPANTVRGAEPGGWAASELIVSFGGRGSGLSATTGQITLDNFQIASGSVVPEPASLAALALAGLLLRRRVRT